VPLNSALTVNGTFTAGSANGLAKLASVEGSLALGNLQTTADTPGGGSLNVAAGGSVALNNSGTTLSVTGGLSDSGSISIDGGAALGVTQGMTSLSDGRQWRATLAHVHFSPGESQPGERAACRSGVPL
jgi:hypothetical protein